MNPPIPPSPDALRDNLLARLDYSVLQQCMHCGMCLPSCPTYAETGRERNSPRGRIALMRAMADNELAMSPSFADEMSHCLGCLACTTACPAGVDYVTLFEAARAEVERSGVRATPARGLLRLLTLRFLFVRPGVLRFAGRLLRWWQAGPERIVRGLRLTVLLPSRLRRLEAMAPRIRPVFSDALIAVVEPSRAPRRFRVCLLTGCMQDLLFSDVNRATADVLVENGCEVQTPPLQPCCGSLHAHNGDPETARALARRQLDLIDPFAVDAIISNAGGCGSHLRHYDKLLMDDPVYFNRAKEWSRKVRDISEWLVEIGFRAPKTEGAHVTTVTYHESCHLCHGQKVSRQPRSIISSIPGMVLRECAEATWCCGSAGIYNITQPETSTWLLHRKVAHLQATGAQIVATANPGCHLQIQTGLTTNAGSVRVVHPVVLLAEAYASERSNE